MKIILVSTLLFFLSSCWISKVTFIDGTMPEEWKTYYVQIPDNATSNSPLNYSTSLGEAMRDGIQNKTRLLLDNNADSSDLEILSKIVSYNISPIAIQGDESAAKNRLSVRVDFKIFVKRPEEDIIELSSNRFVDYDSNTDLASVELQLLDEINEQIVQDVINKLLSNW